MVWGGQAGRVMEGRRRESLAADGGSVADSVALFHHSSASCGDVVEERMGRSVS